VALVFYTAAFGQIEKIKKQSFVLHLTNAKSRKNALQMLEDQAHPVCVVSKEGAFRFYNSKFDELIL